MLFGIGRELIAAFGDGFADANRRHGVLQGLARAHVHDDVAGGHDRYPGSQRHLFNDAAMDVVHRPLMQREPDPRTRRERLAQPVDVRSQRRFVRRKVRHQDRKAVWSAL